VKALVTGSAGQVGSALSKSAPEGSQVVGFDRDLLDITDREAVMRTVEREAPDVIFNAAAYVDVERAERDEVRAFAVNATAVGHLADATREAGALLVHLSTDYVFDGDASTSYAPDAPRNPLSAYGRSKAAGEDAAGGDALILRTSWVHAAGHANFVTAMLRKIEKGAGFAVVADQLGAPTWAKGLAETLWALAAQRACGIFHHRDAGEASWHGFALAIGEEAQALGLIERLVPIRPISTADYGGIARRPAFSLLDDSKTRALLGDTAVHWRTNLRAMLNEEKARG
jgi:dTDP-4-dehydrorhamnose reductase